MQQKKKERKELPMDEEGTYWIVGSVKSLVTQYASDA